MISYYRDESQWSLMSRDYKYLRHQCGMCRIESKKLYDLFAVQLKGERKRKTAAPPKTLAFIFKLLRHVFTCKLHI